MAKIHNELDSHLYKYSRLLDVHRVSDYPGATRAISEVFEEVKVHVHSRGGRAKHPGRLRKHLSIVMLDLYLATHQYPSIYRSVSRSRKDYAPESRNNRIHLSYRLMVRVLDALVDLKYIYETKGFGKNRNDEKSRGFVTRICATEKLVAVMNKHGMNQMFVSRWPSEMIELRDAQKQPVPFEETEDTQRMRKNIERINHALKRALVELYIPDKGFRELHNRLARDFEREPLDLNNKFLVRIFNGSFDNGGRFFGGFWQTIPREFRKYVEINHKVTVEIDYSGMHVRMLYAMKGLQCSDDPYDLKQFDREHQKVAMQCLLNAESQNSARRAVSSKRIPSARALLDALQERHDAIQEYFCTGVGLQLMRIESDIAEEVMLRTIELGGICLPVHDSFLVVVSRENELRACMEEAFQKRFPIAYQVPTKTKKTLLQIESETRDHRNVEGHIQFVTDDLEQLMGGYESYYQRLTERKVELDAIREQELIINDGFKEVEMYIR
ncbi:MAG: hypothetical protein J0H09_04610 [Burkholderiales bacterium]|nr:hypothetical protein [Burkholderiales bacterium]